MGPSRAPLPAERRSTEFAYARLAEMITSGEIAAGTAVSQAGLAEELGVSRTPLREAARLLQREGLLVGEPNRRLRVAEVSIGDLDALYAMRIAVEALALRVAVPQMGQPQVDELEASLDEIERLAEAGLDADEPHRRFHLQLVAPAGSRFEELSQRMWDHSTRYRSACLTTGSGSTELAALIFEGQRDHRRILEAARTGDGVAAAGILAAHFAHTARFLASRIDGERALPAIDAALASSAAA